MKTFHVEPGFGIRCGGRWHRHGHIVTVDRGEEVEIHVLDSEGALRGHVGTHRYDDLDMTKPPLGLRRIE